MVKEKMIKKGNSMYIKQIIDDQKCNLYQKMKSNVNYREEVWKIDANPSLKLERDWYYYQ